jgi:ABC-type nickel/cobalt efflux system permease component RcnA
MPEMKRSTFLLAVITVAALAGAAHAAKSPFGIGTPETGSSGFGGPLGPFFMWIALHQAHFYRALTSALSTLKQDPLGVWLLLALSFAYGVFHAVGPGHGKAVITSYLLASGETVRRGVLISFAAALVQAASAILFVAVGAIVLRLTATAITFATDWVEIISYGAIALVGAWLLWTKSFGGGHHHHHHVEPAPAHDHRHDHDAHDHNVHEHEHAHAHRHEAPAKTNAGALARAWGAILAVGIRPCSGAIIVLVFALSQGLLAAGIAAAVVMALGTGLTVAVLAALAVSARGVALRLAGGVDSPVAYRLVRTLEIGGAACVLLFGLVLLGGSLAMGLPT